MLKQTRVLVTGAGGFIGHHLVKYLTRRNYWVRGVDIKHPEFEPTEADEFELLDLRRWENCLQATRGIDEVYALGADMGGILACVKCWGGNQRSHWKRVWLALIPGLKIRYERLYRHTNGHW